MQSTQERHVRLFRNGSNQAIRIPREFELKGKEAIIRKEGNRLIIEAAPPKSLVSFLDGLTTLKENLLIDTDSDLLLLDDIDL